MEQREFLRFVREGQSKGLLRIGHLERVAGQNHLNRQSALHEVAESGGEWRKAVHTGRSAITAVVLMHLSIVEENPGDSDLFTGDRLPSAGDLVSAFLYHIFKVPPHRRCRRKLAVTTTAHRRPLRLVALNETNKVGFPRQWRP
jgi:hypothetical protein